MSQKAKQPLKQKETYKVTAKDKAERLFSASPSRNIQNRPCTIGQDSSEIKLEKILDLYKKDIKIAEGPNSLKGKNPIERWKAHQNDFRELLKMQEEQKPQFIMQSPRAHPNFQVREKATGPEEAEQKEGAEQEEGADKEEGAEQEEGVSGSGEREEQREVESPGRRPDPALYIKRFSPDYNWIMDLLHKKKSQVNELRFYYEYLNENYSKIQAQIQQALLQYDAPQLLPDEPQQEVQERSPKNRK